MALAKTFKLIGVAAVLASAGSVYAAAAPCGTTPGLNTSDVTYSVTGASPFTDATDCAGVFAGNINNGTTINDFGGNWLYADATDEASSLVTLFGAGFTFTLTEDTDAGANTGNYTLSAPDPNGQGTPPDFPIDLDFVVGLKASNAYALYFFDNALFDGSGGGGWAVKFSANNQGVFPDVSHMIVFVREGSSSSSSSGLASSSGDIPEPSSSMLALLGLGLVGGSLLMRRKARQA